MSSSASAKTSSVFQWLHPLRALRARGAEVIGDAYARAASSLLVQQERLEDQAAERRHLRLARAVAAQPAAAIVATGTPGTPGAPTAQAGTAVAKPSLPTRASQPSSSV